MGRVNAWVIGEVVIHRWKKKREKGANKIGDVNKKKKSSRRVQKKRGGGAGLRSYTKKVPQFEKKSR